MDNGGIWPGDESYFQNIRETALQDTIEQLTKELAETQALVERKDALIRQMWDALSVLVASAPPSGPLWHGSAEMQIAKAALSAAERGN